MTKPRATNSAGYCIEQLTPAGWVGVTVIVDTLEEAESMLRWHIEDKPAAELRVYEALKGSA